MGPVIWVIYDHPTDFPDNFVVRKWVGDKATPLYALCPSLEAARAMVSTGRTRIPRNPDDPPRILETWV